ncbi:MAG: ACP S-malonyltransferase [Clostridia bacterium]|nr:ACP S-malonyltransferase [Clostridia bacterium]
MRFAFVFPGQGVQKTGMGKDFVENYDFAKEMLDKASKASGLDLYDLIMNEEQKDKLDRTMYTQPCLTAICLIMAEALKREGIEPVATSGLSLGEYCALTTAGVLSFEDAVRITSIRGKLMEEAAPDIGGMAAILGLEDDEISEAIKDIDDCYVANYNCPGQAVITGLKEQVDKACEVLQAKGARKVMKLNCSGPFHSPLLNEAAKKLGEALNDVTINDAAISYGANVTGTMINPEDKVDVKKNLVDQIVSSVKYKQSLVDMNKMDIDLFIEVGPGKTISGFIRKTLGMDAAIINVSTIEDIDKVKAVINEVMNNA